VVGKKTIYECVGIFSFKEITLKELSRYDYIEIDRDFKEVRAFKEVIL